MNSKRMPTPRRGKMCDVAAILELEKVCFTEDRRESTGVLRRSLSSPVQEVWVVDHTIADATVVAPHRIPERAFALVAAMILRRYRKTMRIYSLAVAPFCQGQGIGQSLMRLAVERARRHGCVLLSLEAETENTRLVQWYRGLGFVEGELLPDYYSAGAAAVRMRCDVKPPPDSCSIPTIGANRA